MEGSGCPRPSDESTRSAEPVGTAAGTTDRMSRLVGEIRDRVRSAESPGETSRRVAELMAERVGEDGLLTAAQRTGSGDGYTQHVVHVEEDGAFSVVSLVWRPGQETPIHDHVSWCVPAVHRGREAEVRYDGMAEGEGVLDAPREAGDVDYLVERERGVNESGDVTALTPPGDIHRVWNPGPGKAISVHVYGADIRELGSSIRRCYEQPVREEARPRS